MFIVSENAAKHVSFTLTNAPVAIGRAASNQMVVDDPEVDDLHCLIDRCSDGALRLTDLSVRGGVLLNGHRIEVEARLQVDDVVQIGKQRYKIAEHRPPNGIATQKQNEQRTTLPAAKRRPLFLNTGAHRSKSNAFAEHQLEVVTYWGNTVLSVDHFHPGEKGFSDVTIGPPNAAQVLSGDQSLSATWVLAEAVDDAYILRLKDGMRAKVQASGQGRTVTKLNDHSELMLSKDDVARVRHGMVDYLIRFVQLPVVQLPDLRHKNKVLTWSALVSAVMYAALMVLALTVKPMRDAALVNVFPEPSPWMIVDTAPTQKPVPVQEIKPPVTKPATTQQLDANAVKAPPTKSHTLQPQIQTRTHGLASARPLEQALAPPSSGGGPVTPPSSRRSAPLKGTTGVNAPGADAPAQQKPAMTDLSSLGGSLGKVLATNAPGAVRVQFRDGPGGAGPKQGTAGRDYNLGGVGRNDALSIAGGGQRLGDWGESGRGPAGEGSLTRSLTTPGGRSTKVAVNVAKPQDPVSQVSLSMEEVYAVIRQNLNQVRHCYEQKLQRSPNTIGTVKVRFAIVGGGRVASPEIAQDTIGDAAMNGCILEKISRWSFPNPRAGSINVSYPFNFTPQL